MSGQIDSVSTFPSSLFVHWRTSYLLCLHHRCSTGCPNKYNFIAQVQGVPKISKTAQEQNIQNRKGTPRLYDVLSKYILIKIPQPASVQGVPINIPLIQVQSFPTDMKFIDAICLSFHNFAQEAFFLNHISKIYKNKYDLYIKNKNVI